MGVLSYTDYANNLIEDALVSYDAIEPVDMLEFVTSSEYLNETPTTFQSLTIKVLYNLWEKYPPTPAELKLIETLKRNWDITIELDREDPVEKLVMALGRRSTKSTTASFIATYAVYVDMQR